jgi:bifunctional DNase/RNase
MAFLFQYNLKEIKLRKLSMQELDAIALALRFNAPILPIKHLDKAGIYLKANWNPTKTQEIDDVLSNPETFGREGRKSIWFYLF